jgi:hypothetical protein
MSVWWILVIVVMSMSGGLNGWLLAERHERERTISRLERDQRIAELERECFPAIRSGSETGSALVRMIGAIMGVWIADHYRK